jgi:hypothetical protein
MIATRPPPSPACSIRAMPERWAPRSTGCWPKRSRRRKRRPPAQGPDRPARRLRLFRLDGRQGLCRAGPVGRSHPPRGPARPLPPGRRRRHRRARSRGLRHAARQHPARCAGHRFARRPAADRRSATTCMPSSIRWKCNCPSCSACSAIHAGAAGRRPHRAGSRRGARPLWGGPETLIVVSSDLSHFLPYATAQQVDSNTCRHILQLDTSHQLRTGLRRLSDQRPAARRPPRGLKPNARPVQLRRHGRRQVAASSATPAFALTARGATGDDLGTTLLTRPAMPSPRISACRKCRPAMLRNCKNRAPPSSP